MKRGNSGKLSIEANVNWPNTSYLFTLIFLPIFTLFHHRFIKIRSLTPYTFGMNLGPDSCTICAQPLSTYSFLFEGPSDKLIFDFIFGPYGPVLDLNFDLIPYIEIRVLFYS